MLKQSFLLIIFSLVTFYLVGQDTISEALFKPIPNWVKSYPKPKIKSEYKRINCVNIHDELQYNHVTGESFIRTFYYINNKKGIDELSYIKAYLETDYANIYLHKAVIYRENKLISLKDDLRTQRVDYKNKVGVDNYFNEANFYIYLNQLKEKDLVEVVYTIKGKQPDLQNWLVKNRKLVLDDFIGKDYFRVLNYPNEPIYYTILNTDEKPTIQDKKDYYIFELITKATKVNREEQKEGFIPYKKVFLTSKSNWNEVVNLNLKNHQLEIPASESIKNKVALLTKGMDEKADKIKAIFDFIQRDITYLAYGLINPKRPEVTLEKQYGDCKSKSLLTIKMLECIDIPAFPVVVHSEGIDERTINSHAFIFDHEVIEFVYQGDTILFDSTVDFVKGKDVKRYTEKFKYGLRLIEGTNELTKFSDELSGKLVLNQTFNYYRNNYNNLVLDGKKEIKFYGEIAEQAYKIKQQFDIYGLWSRFLKDDRYDDPCIVGNGSTSSTFDADSIAYYKLAFEIQSCEKAIKKAVIQPNLFFSWWREKELERNEAKPNFTILPFEAVVFNYKVVVPDSLRFENDSLVIKNDWLNYKQIFRKDADTIFATYTINLLKTELPISRFQEVNKVILEMQDAMKIELHKDNFPKLENYEKHSRWVPLLILIGGLTLGSFLLWWNFSTLRKRKQKIKVLKSEIIALKEKLKIDKPDDSLL
jgi:hypothetical protein